MISKLCRLFLIISIVLLAGNSILHASPNLCSLILGKAAHQKHDIAFSKPYNDYISKHSKLTPIAADALSRIIQDPMASKLLIKAFISYGMIQKTWLDPHYVPLLLLNQNKEINLKEKHPQPEVHKWLQRRQKDLSSIIGDYKVLEPLSAKDRYENLRDIILSILAQISETESLKVLNNLFTKINELYVNNELSLNHASSGSIYREMMLLFQSHELVGVYTFKPFSKRIGKGEQGFINSIPLIGTTLNLISHTESIVYERMLKNRKSIEKSAPYKDRELIPGSLQLVITNPDYNSSQVRMHNFIRKYMDKDVVDYKSFAEDANASFSELAFVKFGSLNWTKTHLSGNKKLQDIFGEGTNTYYRALKRLLYFFALLQGNKKYFPKITQAELDQLSEHLRIDLHLDSNLSKPENIPLIDKFLSFLMLDLLGRSSHPSLNKIDDYKEITKKFGFEIEKRSLEMIKAYPYASPNFIRQSKTTRDQILANFEVMQHISLGQLLQMEAGYKSLEYLNQLGGYSKSLILWRNFLGFLSIQSENRALESGVLTSFQVKQWILLYESIFGDRQKHDPQRSYLHLVSFLNDLSRISKKLEPPMSLDYGENSQAREDLALARLFRITRQSKPEDLDKLRMNFNKLSEERKAQLISVLSEGEFQLYYASELYRKLRKKHQEHPKEDYALDVFFDIIINSYILAKREFRLPSLKANNPKIEIRLNYTKLLLDLDKQVDYGNLQITETLNGFEISFR